MKKAALLLLALAVLGGAVFADDLAYELSGSASLTWGYNLNTEAHGFTNVGTAELVVPLVGGSSTHGEDPITGWIKLDGFYADVIVDDTGSAFDSDIGTITARILFPNDLYVQIYNKPGFSIANAKMQLPIYATATGWTAVNRVTPSIASAGGFILGMTSDLSFALKVGSTNNHTDGLGQANDYHIGIDVSYAVEDLGKFGANLIYGSFQDDPANIGLGAYANLAFMEDALTVYLGTDFNLKEAFKGLDLQFDLGYTLADVVKATLGAYMYKGLEDTDFDNPFLTLTVGANLLAVENLTFGVKFSAIDMLDENEYDAGMIMGLSANLAYVAALDEGYLKPYANLGMIFENDDRGQLGITTLSVGVEAKFFPLTVFDLKYAAGTITANSYNPFTGKSIGSDELTEDKGTITFKTTITY